MQSWDSVKVTNEKHARAGQVGRVIDSQPAKDSKGREVIRVEFDTDKEVVPMFVADLAQL